MELNLPGIRQRRRTSYDAEKVHRSCSIVGVCPDGSLYLLESFSLDRNLASAQHGYVRKSNGQIYAIDWTDLHLSKIPEETPNLPTVLNVRFAANGEVFSTAVYATTKKATLVGTVPRGYESDVLMAQIGIGFVLFYFCSIYRC